MESDRAQLLQDAVDKAKQDPGTLNRILRAYFQSKSTQSIRFYLNDDADTLCTQPGNRPALIQIAVDKAKENPSSIPAQHANDPQAYFESQSTQFICSYITNREFIPATSQLQMAPVLIPMVYPPTGKLYDFVDVVQLHDGYGAQVDRTDTGVILHGGRNIMLMDRTLDTVDSMRLDWLIDTVTDEGQALAREWGQEMFEQDAWLDALQGMKDVQVESSELYRWSNRHRPLNIDNVQPQPIVATARFQQQSSQEQNNVWPTQRADGSYMLPISVADARLLLENFEPARLAMEAGTLVPLEVLNSFLADESFRSMDTDGESQDRKMQEAVMVYMWSVSDSIPDQPIHIDTVERMLQSRGLDELLDAYFFTSGRRTTWLRYVSFFVRQQMAVTRNPWAIMDMANPSPEVQLAAVQTNPDVIHVIAYPSLSLQLAAVTRNGNAIQYIENPSPDAQLAAVKQNGNAIQYIENPSLGLQLAAVKQNGNAIQYLENPSLELQLAAVTQNGSAIQRIQNPSQRLQVAAVKQNGIVIEYIENPSLEVQLAAVKQNGYAIKTILEKGIEPYEIVQLAAVKQDGYVIHYIENPSLEVQLAAVTRNPNAIKYIQNSSLEVQLAVVKQDGFLIREIPNPSLAVQLAAVKQRGWALHYIQNPSPDVQLAAVKQNGNAIQYIENPSPELQLIAVEQSGYAIQRIQNPSQRLQLAAVKENGIVIEYIENPSLAVQLAAVQQTGDAIDYIENPSLEVQLAAVKQKGYAIKYIENPSLAVQLAAVTRDGYAIKWILDKGIEPSEEVQLAAVNQDGDAIRYIDNPSPEVQRMAQRHIRRQ